MNRSFKTLLLLVVILSSTQISKSQNVEKLTTNVLRFNIINPGIEYEMAVSEKSTLSSNIGVGFGNPYGKLTNILGYGLNYNIAPFLDIEYKYLYNLPKRGKEGKNTDYNSGNYFGIRSLMRGKAFKETFIRYVDYDLAVGPTWGLQRSWSRIHFLFEINTLFVTDGTRHLILPSIQINLGWDAFKF